MESQNRVAEHSAAPPCYAELVDALRNDSPNKHDCVAGADAISRLERFRIGALRAIEKRDRIQYGWNLSQYGYFSKDEIGVTHWAGDTIEDAVMQLGGYSA